MQNTKIIFKLILQRSIYTTAPQNDIGRTMSKVLKHPKRRKPFFEDPIYSKSNTFEKSPNSTKTQGRIRRINVLNKLFMRHITDFMATGEMASIYSGLGLEINRVEVTPDFLGINVFYVAHNTHPNIEEMLKDSGRIIKHELTWLNVIGNVPNIHFVRDKIHGQIVEIDKRLAKADFGEDYEPSESILKVRKELCVMEMKLKEQVRKEILKLDDVEIDEDVPEMPQDVLGLNHKDIMDRIKISLKKSRSTPKITNVISTLNEVNTKPIEFKSIKTQREVFKEFLIERQNLKRKIRKNKLKASPEVDYFTEEFFELKEKEFDDLQINGNVDDKDFIEEDFDDSNLKEKF
ncbi:uncharacterized protein [Onthophagus taurus]|uniref:uncharacterized protein n=1 Tax=Onthophagus taurus TaxID=166361 RepID=UPI0039BEA481